MPDKRRKKRPYKKGRRGDDQREDMRDKRNRDDDVDWGKAGANDISWYAHNPNLLVAAAQFPFPNRPGMEMDLGTATVIPKNLDGKVTLAVERKYMIPGIMVLDWAPSLGRSQKATDPASVLGREMYGKVRRAYSGSLDVDGPDLVMYVMAMDSIYSYIAYLRRIYRLLVAWTPNNYIMPDVVIKSMGFNDYDVRTLREQRTKLWQYINELVLQSGKFTVPAQFDIINRHYWMSDNIYTDSDSMNSQLYMFNLRWLYKFAEQTVPNSEAKASGLEMVQLPQFTNSDDNLAVSADTLYQFGLDLINALIEWDDAYTINGYLMRAFEGVPTFSVDQQPLDQPVTPLYVEEVLIQIENSMTVLSNYNLEFSNFDLNVSQDPVTNAVLCNNSVTLPSVTSGIVWNAGLANQTTLVPFISQRSDQPSVEMNVVATRLKAALDGYTLNQDKAYIMCATEIPLMWRVIPPMGDMPQIRTAWQGGTWNGGFAGNPTVLQQCLALPTATGTFFNAFMNILAVEAFDWHPLIFVTDATLKGTGADTTVESSRTAIVGDVHNVTTISMEALMNLHRVCLFSEFNSFGIF